MKKEFAIIVKGNELKKIGRFYCSTPKPQAKKNQIKWFDDTKLIKEV